jgi:hypothetical protein
MLSASELLVVALPLQHPCHDGARADWHAIIVSHNTRVGGRSVPTCQVECALNGVNQRIPRKGDHHR